MADTFLKRAPEIAEEILAKVAGLPKSLQSFPQELLEKQADDRREKLELPKAMTLADLQKIASGNEVNLPKIASVKTEDFGSIAADLVKIAQRQDDDAEEIFLTAVAIVAQRYQEKTAAAKVPKAPKTVVLKPSVTAHATPAAAAPAVARPAAPAGGTPWHAPATAPSVSGMASPRIAVPARPAPVAAAMPGSPPPAPITPAMRKSMRPPTSHTAPVAAHGDETPGVFTRLKAKMMGPESPAGFKVEEWKNKQRARVAESAKGLPDPARDAMKAEKAENEAKRTHSAERADKFLAAAPTMMLAAGTPLAAAAALRPREREKKEEVKIYK